MTAKVDTLFENPVTQIVAQAQTWSLDYPSSDLLSFVVKVPDCSIRAINNYLSLQSPYINKSYLKFSPDNINQFATLIGTKLTQSIGFLKIHPLDVDIRFNKGQIFSFFYGIKDSPFYGLSLDIELGFEPTEQQITRGICSFIFDNVDASLKLNRTRSFLKAILFLIKPDSHLLQTLDAEIFDLQVSAEEPTSKKKRIDILITWFDRNLQKYAVVIEAKFSHKVTKGQLPEYKRYATNNIKVRPENRALILLTVNGQKSSRKDDRNKEWKSLTWFNLLRRWEYEIFLAQDQDIEFSRFRKIIWFKQ